MGDKAWQTRTVETKVIKMQKEYKLGQLVYDTGTSRFRTFRGFTSYNPLTGDLELVFSEGTEWLGDAETHAIIFSREDKQVHGLDVFSTTEAEERLVDIDIRNIAVYADYDTNMNSWVAKPANKVRRAKRVVDIDQSMEKLSKAIKRTLEDIGKWQDQTKKERT